MEDLNLGARRLSRVSWTTVAFFVAGRCILTAGPSEGSIHEFEFIMKVILFLLYSEVRRTMERRDVRRVATFPSLYEYIFISLLIYVNILSRSRHYSSPLLRFWMRERRVTKESNKTRSRLCPLLLSPTSLEPVRFLIFECSTLRVARATYLIIKVVVKREEAKRERKSSQIASCPVPQRLSPADAVGIVVRSLSDADDSVSLSILLSVVVGDCSRGEESRNGQTRRQGG